MKWYQYVIGTAIILAIFSFGLIFCLWLVPSEQVIVEKNVSVDCPACPVVECPVRECPACSNVTIIERTTLPCVQECPECRCNCVSHGAWADNKTWWYQDKNNTYTS